MNGVYEYAMIELCLNESSGAK